MEWTLPKYSESHGMSTLFHRITKTVPSLFHEIFLERNFDGNPTSNVTRSSGGGGGGGEGGTTLLEITQFLLPS
jgi:hypothetical protein